MQLVAPLLLGIVLGILFAHLVFLGGFLTLGVWGITGLGIGWLSRNKKEALLTGGLFGFVVSLAFLITDYQGSISIAYRIFPFALLSLVGLAGGLILGILGFLFRKLLKK